MLVDEMEVPSVPECIRNTIKKIPGYFEKTLASRQPGGTGSTFECSVSQEDLEGFSWRSASHPEVALGCLAFKAEYVPGLCGMIHVPSQAGELIGRAFRLEDPKDTGFASAVLVGPGQQFRTPTNSCWLVVGEHEGEYVVYTFHPGAPVSPTPVRVDKDLDMSREHTVAEVLAFGLEWAKIQA